MKSIFRDIILERQLEMTGDYVPRERPHRVVPGKALAVIGIRRCGKTTFLRQIWDELRHKRNVQPSQMVYVNFFDERLFDLKATQLGKILEAFDELHPTLDPSTDIFFFLDEIQVVKGWELFVDRLLRSKNRHVFLSGSSATLLSKELSTAMRGRSLSLEMFPFSFKEVLNFEGITTRNPSPRERARTIARFRDYLSQGGFPEVLKVDPVSRRQILQEYVNVVLFKDVIERHSPSDTAGVAYTLRLLMNQIGSPYTINKTAERLAAAGHKVTKAEVSKFISWFQDSYLLFPVPIFANSVSRQTVNPRKIYCIDSGLVHNVQKGTSGNLGHLLENAVYLHLRRRTEDIRYFKDAQQREVDFVVSDPEGGIELLQVTSNLGETDVRAREILAMESAMSHCGVKLGTIITLDEEEEIKSSRGTIRVIPAWRYFLE